MAVRFTNRSAHGLLAEGSLQYANNANVDRILLFQLQVNVIPPVGAEDPNVVRRFVASNDANLSTVRLVTLGDGRIVLAVERTSGSRYAAFWPFSSDNWATITPFSTIVVRIGGTPGSGRTALWKNGSFVAIGTEENTSGSYASVTHTNQFCIGSTGTVAAGFDNTRTLPSLIDFAQFWLGQAAYASSGSFIVSDSVCAALSRGVAPSALGLPRADVGYKFEQDGGIIQLGAAPIARIDDGGFERGQGFYRFSATPVLVPVLPSAAPTETLPITIADPVANAEDSIGAALAPQTASIIDPVPDAEDSLQGQLGTIAAAIDDPVADAIDSIQSGIVTDLLPVVINDPIADAEDAVAGGLGAAVLAIDDPVADAQDAIQGQLSSVALAIDDPVADAQDSVLVQLGAQSIGVAIADPVADAVDQVAVLSLAAPTIAIVDPVADAVDGLTLSKGALLLFPLEILLKNSGQR